MLLLSALPSQPVMIGGDERAEEVDRRGIASGAMKGAFCLTEPNHGSDAANLETRAVRDGDDYILNGEKMYISGGTVADYVVAFAQTDGTPGARGISGFIVDDGDAGLHGRADRTARWASAASRRPTSSFEDCRVPRENLIGGDEGAGLQPRDAHAELLPAGRRRARPRPGGRRDDVRARVRAPARGVRQADRRPAGDPVHVRRHGDPDRSGAAARLPGRVARRPGAVRPRARRVPLDRQGVRDGGRRSRCRATRCRCWARRAT